MVKRPLVFFRLKVGEGVGLGRNPELRIINMGIYLRCVEIIVSQELLQCANVNTVLQHQRSGCMPELMR